MREFPKIGSKIKFHGNLIIPKLTGVVTKHFPGHNECPDMVAAKPDILPKNWPYPGSDNFVCHLDEIELIQET